MRMKSSVILSRYSRLWGAISSTNTAMSVSFKQHEMSSGSSSLAHMTSRGKTRFSRHLAADVKRMTRTALGMYTLVIHCFEQGSHGMAFTSWGRKSSYLSSILWQPLVPWRAHPQAGCDLLDMGSSTSNLCNSIFSAAKIDGEYYIVGGAATYCPVRETVNEIHGLRKDLSVKPLVISIGSGLEPQTKTPNSQSFASQCPSTQPYRPKKM